MSGPPNLYATNPAAFHGINLIVVEEGTPVYDERTDKFLEVRDNQAVRKGHDLYLTASTEARLKAAIKEPTR